MGLYSRALRHIDMNRVKELREDKIRQNKIAEEIREQIREELRNLNSPEFSNWRHELNEMMTTSDVFYTTLPAVGDVDLANSDWGNTKPSGLDSGFDDKNVSVSGNTLTLSGSIVAPDTINSAARVITGGDEYDTLVVDVISSGSRYDIGGALPPFEPYGSGSSSARFSIPFSGRLSLLVFTLDPGAVTFTLTLQRRTPVNVFAKLDSPEASSFIRTNPIMTNLSPQERLKKLKEMLEASDEYVAKMLGLDFPGTGAVAPGEYDPFKQAPPGEAGDTPGVSVSTLPQSGDNNYGLPSDYKERLIKANAYFQNNVKSIPVNLGLHAGSTYVDRTAELRRQSFKKAGFTDKQIETIEKNNLLQTKFDPSKKMSGVKSSLPAYDPNVSLNRTNVNVDPETFQKLVAQQKYQQDLAAYEKAVTAHKQKSDNLSKAVDAARAAYLKSGQSAAQRQQSYSKLQAAIKAGTDHANSTLKNPITKPPATQTPQSKLTPQQLADIDKQIKDLQAQSEKNKQNAAYNMNMARLNAVIGGASLGAMIGITGGAALGLGAGGAATAATRAAIKTGPAAARRFAKANPGKYNPFLSQQANKYFNLKNSYELQGQVISEKKLKSPKEVLNKIPGYYDGKPAPLGFPVEPPPKMVNGMHPDLVDGKKVAGRFNRLDPESARAMPPTGNPHIDKKVRAAAKKPK